MNKSLFSKIISDLRSERKTEISQMDDKIEITYPAISAKDFKTNRIILLWLSIMSLFALAGSVNVLFLFAELFDTEVRDHGMLLLLPFLLQFVALIAFPIYIYKKGIRNLFMTEKLLLTPQYFTYSQSIWGNFKEILRIPKKDLAEFKIAGHPSLLIRLLSKAQSSDIKNHLYVYHRKGKQEIMGGRTNDEYMRLCEILESYRTTDNIKSVTKTENITIKDETTDQPDEKAPEPGKSLTLIIASAVLIGIGIFETFLLITVITKGGSFSGGAFIYIIAGVLLLRRKKETCQWINRVMTILFCLVFAGFCFVMQSVIWFFLIKDQTVSYVGDFSIFSLLYFLYAISVPLIVMLLNHPSSRRSMGLEPTRGRWQTFFLSGKKSAIVLCVGILLFGFISGPHIIQNPLKIIADEFRTSQEVKDKLGNIRSLKLKKYRLFNWKVYTEWDAEGDKMIASYYANYSYGKNVQLNLFSYKNKRQQHSVPWNGTESAEARAREVCLPEVASKSDLVMPGFCRQEL